MLAPIYRTLPRLEQEIHSPGTTPCVCAHPHVPNEGFTKREPLQQDDVLSSGLVSLFRTIALTSWPACALKESALAERARETGKEFKVSCHFWATYRRPGQVTELGVEASFWPGKQTRGTVLCCISGQRQQPALSLPQMALNTRTHPSSSTRPVPGH